MKKIYLKKSGFTLIELLVVIVIIGVLATLATIALGSVRAKARDSKRISDIRQMQTALEMYKNDNGVYPNTNNFVSGVPLTASGQTYMNKIPRAPLVNDGSCASDVYEYASTGPAYTLNYCLGSAVQNINSGNCVATPGNICGPASPVSIGQDYQGGIVAYINESGGVQHGLIIAPNDYNDMVSWGCYDTPVGTSMNYNQGENNTNAISNNSCSTNDSAAKICYNLDLNNKQDWYLPSFNELEFIFQNKTFLPEFPQRLYWTSSETTSNARYNAEIKNYITDTQSDVPKDMSFYVRCVRSF